MQAGGTPIGLTFWQSVTAGSLLLFYVLWRHRKFYIPKSLYLPILIISLLSVVIPNIIFYSSAAHLDAGILSISVSVIPLFTYVIALVLRMDKFRITRAIGLLMGFMALLILILPDNSLPDPQDIPWVLLSLICALCYALENIYIDRLTMKDFGPIRLVCSVSLLCMLITLPLSLATNQFFIPKISNLDLLLPILGLGTIGATAYSVFIVLINRAGSVFASQTGYLVTFCGVLWGIVLLGESHSVFVWLSLFLIMAGIFLVQPRGTKANDTIAHNIKR
jgi:drug/metabolite transporter (DMT)-like permease